MATLIWIDSCIGWEREECLLYERRFSSYWWYNRVWAKEREEESITKELEVLRRRSSALSKILSCFFLILNILVNLRVYVLPIRNRKEKKIIYNCTKIVYTKI
ncbi:hypothetical protein HPP92_008431 [Vanilla planifolia]|uniref:Uncharacterized protein n=1 Tax=Vanilla planifolia TaxID=51239 RepID=A0A835R5Z9_VANPL|nr:hypothetical protein HPP92_008431 [Vanilla planifolia]